MRPGDRLLSRLRDIVYYGDRAKETVRNRQFAEMESVEIDALCYLVLIVTEAALRALALDPQIATRHGEIPWHEIRGTGNRLRHGYATLDRQEFVKSAVADGAQVVTGGELIELDNGNFLQPTVLTNFNEGMAVMRDEVFIPVLPLRRSAVSTKAIERANDSTYGLPRRSIRRISTRRCVPSTNSSLVRRTSIARTSRRCKASMPVCVVPESAARTASTACTLVT